ncbi:hypothetical protein OWV82_023150 [Melia azedarach]|uniref:Uncharacterized protein n=1 Tax=Melia azedarach TaxID=155640 RepID=A0ACC1WVP0_MELAZ|nr:hypothetical protein OWV82_023150 [Melia azedarach]
MLAQLRKAYDILSSIKLSFPRPRFRPSRPGSNEVVIHCQSFEYGLRLPIQLFFAQILSVLGVAPAQLSSMAWRNLARLYILWKEVLGVEPTIEDVHATFALTTAPKKPGLYYLRMYIGQPHLVPQVNSNTADKAWDDFWFVISGKWTRDLSRDTDLKSVREYVATNPSEIDIVTEERLAKVGLIPPPSSGEIRDEVGSVKTQLRAQVEKANELQPSVDKLETEAGSNLLHGYHYAQYQVTREFPDLDLHYMDFGFDRDALVAKFGKEQNPADIAGSSQQLTSGHPLNLEVSPLHSDQEEDNSDDEGS